MNLAIKGQTSSMIATAPDETVGRMMWQVVADRIGMINDLLMRAIAVRRAEMC